MSHRHLPSLHSLRSLVALGGLTSIVLAAPAVLTSSAATTDLTNLDLEALMSVVVVTATQNPADPFALPFAVSSRAEDELTRLQSPTFPQALEGLPSVMIQKTSFGQESPFIRGFTGFRTLLLLDGIRLNNSTFRDGPNQYWTTVDPASLARVELVAGPAAVLYGSDSVGGTVQALTPVTDFATRSPHWQGDLSQRVASGGENFSHSRVAATGPLGPRTQAAVGATFTHFGDFRAGPATGRVRASGYDQAAFDAKLEHLFASHLRLTVAHQTVTQDDVARTHSTIHGDTWAGTTHGTDLRRSADQARALTYARIEGSELKGPLSSAEVTLSFHRQTEHATRVRADSRREAAVTLVDTYGLQSHLQSESALGQWNYGFTFYRDEVDTSQDRYLANGTLQSHDVQGPVADDSRYDLAGLFVQNTLPQVGPLALTARARYDLATAHAGRLLDPATNQPTSFHGSWGSWLGSLRATYRLPTATRSEWQFYAGSSQGFRAPNLSDLSRLDATSSNRIETPSTSVQPERYLIHELGLKIRSSRVHFTATLYRTTIDGMIIRRPTGRLVNGLVEVTKLNSGDGYLHGAEVSLQYAVTASVTFTTTSSWMEGEVTAYPSSDPTVTLREPLSRMMPFTTHLALRYTPPQSAYWLEAAGSAATRQNRLSEGDRADTDRIPPGGTPGYAVAHLRAGWTPRPWLSLTAALENVTDRDYRIHGSGVNEPGRTVLLTARFRH